MFLPAIKDDKEVLKIRRKRNYENLQFVSEDMCVRGVVLDAGFMRDLGR